MPFLRGWAHLPAQDRGETAGFVVLTNDRWNHTMSSVGVVPIRSRVMPFDLPFSVPLPNGDAVVASRLVSLDERDPKRSLLGPANGSLGGSVRACRGDATTMQLHSVMLNPRDRPVPSTSTMTDMQAIARGLTVAYGLEASLRRVGGEVAPPDRA